jgi:hypothetical protein
MTSKTTSKTTTKATRKTTTRTARKKSNRINRQRRLQKQLQILLLERHSRRCIICHHPEREAIEEEFVHWRAPWKLAQDYKLDDYRTVYRHARAAGLLLQRRERLHSALDAFVESVDDVTFTGDTILRAMRAYSCIDAQGRWTEIPTQVQISTFHDGHPTPSPHPKNGSTATSDILDIVPKYSNHASRSDTTACAASPAQALNVTDDEYDEPEHDPENDADHPNGDDSDPDDDPDDDKDPKNKSDVDSLEETTACAASPAQALPRDVLRGQNPNDRSPSDRSDCASPMQNVTRHAAQPNRSPLQQETGRAATATACAASSAQALPRESVRGQNPNDRSPFDRTDCAAIPAQPAAPKKPKPDADGIIWHPRPGYPNQEMSEPDAQGRVMYKIHITPAAPQLPSRETDARRAAELIYRSVIKKYGNP